MQDTVIFDTLKFSDELTKAGINKNQSDAITKATSKAMIQFIETYDVSTKKDLTKLKDELQVFIIKTVSASVFFLSGFQTIFHFLK